MSKHNTRHNGRGGSQGHYQSNRGSRNNQPWVAPGLTTLNIPETVVEAVKQQDKEMSPPILLRGFGADFFHCVGKVLVVRKAIRSDWRANRDKIIAATRNGNRKQVAERIEQYCMEGAVILDSLVLPETPGEEPRRILRLRHEHLAPGDRWEVITVHKHRGNGVWCRFEVEAAQEYRRGMKEVIRGAFPIIGGVTGNDPGRAENMLRRLSAFCHMRLSISSFEEFKQYMGMSKGEWEEHQAEFNEERAAAVKALRAPDIAAADHLVEFSQNCGGFSTKDPNYVDPELQEVAGKAYLAQLETKSKNDPVHVVSSFDELEDLQRQVAEGKELEEAMRALREEAAAKDNGLVTAGVTAGVTAERPPTLPAKAQRAAALVRTAVSTFQRPAAAAPAAVTVQPVAATPATPAPMAVKVKPRPVLPAAAGVPAWMSMPLRQ